MSKPSILLIPGSFARPDFYDVVLDAVTAEGYGIRGLHLPSVGLETGPREGPPPTMYDDASFIAKETKKLADEGKDVILVSHSYGGVPTTESTRGLGKEERQKQGKNGGIVRLAYMTAVVPAVGVSAAGVLADVPTEQKLELKADVCFPPWVFELSHPLMSCFELIRRQENGWMYHDPISRSAEIAFSDLSKEEGEAWVKRFSQHSGISFAGELTHAGYKDIPVSYLVCEDDMCIPLQQQREGIDRIEKESGRTVNVTSIKAGHCPNTSTPQKVVDWILNVAGKVQ